MELPQRVSVLVGIGVLGCTAAWAQGVTPLDVKLGQWETTVTTVRTGTPPIPPELLAKMSPEDQAKLEQRMKASQGPQTHVAKRCITKDDLAKSFGAYTDNPACKRTVVTSTSSRQEFQIECTDRGMTSTGTVRLEAIDSEHVSGKTKMSTSRGGQPITVDMTISAKWLAAECPANPAIPAKKQP
ncbi:MAG: DUF3617 domain-containing protein [Bryobacteraceae bacterium]